MAIRLPREPIFPDPELAEPDGLLAVGGDLSPERLLRAYAEGIFPWYSDETPILWWSPEPRMVLLPGGAARPAVARGGRCDRARYRIRSDTAFGEVIRRCAEKDRPGQDGTWITDEMVAAYERLHALGHAHSFEAWDDDGLAGGLYGVSLGAAFFGESMYADRPDASKAAFATAVEWMRGRGFELVDCQVDTEHLRRFGAREIPRAEFLARLRNALATAGSRGRGASRRAARFSADRLRSVSRLPPGAGRHSPHRWSSERGRTRVNGAGSRRARASPGPGASCGGDARSGARAGWDGPGRRRREQRASWGLRWRRLGRSGRDAARPPRPRRLVPTRRTTAIDHDRE